MRKKKNNLYHHEFVDRIFRVGQVDNSNIDENQQRALVCGLKRNISQNSNLFSSKIEFVYQTIDLFSREIPCR